MKVKVQAIDSDFDFYRREEVIDYLKRKYGEDRVAQIGTYGTMSSKAVLKDVGRVMGFDHNIINAWNKDLPSFNGNIMPLEDAIHEIPTFINAYKQYPDLFDLAIDLQGMPKSSGVHACFDEDTLVRTTKGLKRIADIQIGDFVLTHKNRYKEVREVMERETDEIYNLRTSSSHPVRVTGNHPMYVREQYRYRKRKWIDGKDVTLVEERRWHEPEWKPVKELTKKHYVGIPVNQNEVIPSFDAFDLPFDKPDFWWIIGRYLGDGWTETIDRLTPQGYPTVEKRIIICCSKLNDDELNDIKAHLDRLNFDYRVEEHRTSYKIFINGQTKDVLHPYLQRYGEYAYGKKIAQEVFDLPVDLGIHFMEGYLSADGNMYNVKDINGIPQDDKVQVQLRTVSKELAIGYTQCVHKFYRRPTSLSFTQPGKDIIEGREVNRRKKYTVSFTTKQLKNQVSFYEDGYIWSKINTLEKEERTQQVYNLTVLDDSSYTANGMAAHNCGLELSPEPLYDVLPLMRSKTGNAVTQYEGPPLEELGLIYGLK